MRDRFQTWWGSLKPYQRELRFAAAFDLIGLALLALAFAGAAFTWPWVFVLPTSMLFFTLMGSVTGLGIAISGQLLGYRIEDRRAARLDRRQVS